MRIITDALKMSVKNEDVDSIIIQLKEREIKNREKQIGYEFFLYLKQKIYYNFFIPVNEYTEEIDKQIVYLLYTIDRRS